MIPEATISKKRDLNVQESFQGLKKMKKEDVEDVCKLFEIVIIERNEETDSNRIWMHSRDIQELFPDKSAPYFVRIDHFVYEVAKREIERGILCMSNYHKSEFKDSVFQRDGTEAVLVSPFSFLKHTVTILTHLELDVRFCFLLPNLQAYDFDQLLALCEQKLKNKVITHQQSFALESKKNYIDCLITTMRGKKELLEGFSPTYGYVNQSTKITFTNKSTDKICIVQEVKNDVARQCTFSVLLKNKKNSGCARSAYRRFKETVLIDFNHFVNAIYEKIKYNILFKGFSLKINYENNHFELFVDQLSGYMTEDLTTPCGHKKGLAPHDQTFFHLLPHHEPILFTRGPNRSMQKASFKVMESEFRKPAKPWVDRGELESKIRERGRFAIDQFFEVELTTGKYMIKLESAEELEDPNAIEIVDPVRVESSIWHVHAESNLTFSVDLLAGVRLVKDAVVLPILELEIEVMHTPEKPKLVLFGADTPPPPPVQLLEAHLLREIQSKVQGQLVGGETFEVKILEESLDVTIKNLAFQDQATQEGIYQLGTLAENTRFKFTSKDEKKVSIIPKKKPLQPEKLIESLKEVGLGGVKEQLNELIRRIVIFHDPKLKDEIAGFGAKPPRGLVLYGPPGTGKTTLGRNFSKFLGCDPERIKFVSGPEILNKWVGNSEKNIRELFEPAIAAQKKWGDESPPFAIIFDEFDSIGGKRGGDSSGVRNSVVTQLLTMMDGLGQLNNIVFIAITNRLDILDPAFLRPGRFEFNLEMGLPNAAGRLEIFEIYTRVLIANNRLSKDVDLKEYADKTKDFSGADIEGMMKTAISYPLQRISENKDLTLEEKQVSFQVTNKDMKKALEESEVRRKQAKDGVPFGMYG